MIIKLGLWDLLFSLKMRFTMISLVELPSFNSLKLVNFKPLHTLHFMESLFPLLLLISLCFNGTGWGWDITVDQIMPDTECHVKFLAFFLSERETTDKDFKQGSN